MGVTYPSICGSVLWGSLRDGGFLVWELIVFDMVYRRVFGVCKPGATKFTVVNQCCFGLCFLYPAFFSLFCCMVISFYRRVL